MHLCDIGCGAKCPPSWWRFEVLRPGGGVSLWYKHAGSGHRLFIVSPREVGVDVDNVRKVLARHRASHREPVAQVLWMSAEIDVPHGFATRPFGHWQTIVFFSRFQRPERSRGAYPEHWRETMDEPLYRWWEIGPLEIRRHRWKGGGA